jgi:hypothetical protein
LRQELLAERARASALDLEARALAAELQRAHDSAAALAGAGAPVLAAVEARLLALRGAVGRARAAAAR